MTIKLTDVRIEGFRGFADAKSVPLDADAIIVSGPNGAGKTSLVDAICWVLTGRLPRLESQRRRQNEEVIVSRYSSGSTARVTLTMDVDGETFMVDRLGTSFSSTLSATRGGSPLEPGAADSELIRALGFESTSRLAHAVDRWVLRQDEVRAVLQANPNELHERLKDLLSLGALDTFEASLEEAAKARSADLKANREKMTTAEQRLRVARAEAESLDSRIHSSPELEPSNEDLRVST
jgi:DNA repair exonuclease SbcCD ATPase subunit